MHVRRGIILASIAIWGGGCGLIIPDVPPDFVLPVDEILLHTACELQETLRSLESPEFVRFKARQWLITVALTPKTDTDVNAAGGFTRKGPFASNPTQFTTWAVSSPGVQLDAKGERTSGVNFTFKSGELIDDVRLPCNLVSPSLHALAAHLGIGSWLRRAAIAVNLAPSANIDKPTYNTDITIKLSGNGSYTFTFPPGTNLASFGGSYMIDEQLNIGMAPLPAPPKPIRVVTLPSGENFGNPKIVTLQVPSTITIEETKQRLDVIQLEQAIRSLQTRQ